MQNSDRTYMRVRISPVCLQLSRAFSTVRSVYGVESDFEAFGELLVHLDHRAELVLRVPLLSQSKP